MNLEELKNQILNNEVSDDFMIFKYADNNFLVKQYLDELCISKNCGLKHINSLFEKNNSALSLVFDLDLDINILEVEEFTESYNDYDSLKNTIVVCNKIDKKLEKQVEEYIVDFTKLLDWQVIDYSKYICPGLTEESYTWLYKACGGNIYKITNELDKVSLFEETERQQIFDQLKSDKYNNLFTQYIFELSDSIVKRDFTVIYEYLRRLKDKNYDPIALANALLNNYKKLAYVRSGKTPKEIGLEDKQVWAIKKNMSTCSDKEVLEKIKFLSNIDLRLKNNQLDAAEEALIGYLINNLLV